MCTLTRSAAPTHPPACLPACLRVVVVLPAAAKLEDVFGQIYKVLKPGGLFLSYEWVSTKHFDPKNAGES
jgi:predicted methyltransferase